MLRQIRAAFAGKQSLANALQLGLAYLWLEDYNAAWEHFDDRNRHYDNLNRGRPNSTIFTNWRALRSGAWTNTPTRLLNGGGDANAATRISRAGSHRPSYFSLPLSWTPPRARATSPKDFSDKRSKSWRYKYWPSPVTDYVLGRIDEDRLQDECSRKNNERGMLAARWEIGFYGGIVALSQGNISRYKKLIREASVTSDDNFDPTSKRYVIDIWKPEFFLARHLAAGIGSATPG